MLRDHLTGPPLANPLMEAGVAHRQMMTERMIDIAPIVIAVIAGSFVAALMPTTTWIAVTMAITAVVVVALWLRRRRPRRR